MDVNAVYNGMDLSSLTDMIGLSSFVQFSYYLIQDYAEIYFDYYRIYKYDALVPVWLVEKVSAESQ